MAIYEKNSCKILFVSMTKIKYNKNFFYTLLLSSFTMLFTNSCCTNNYFHNEYKHGEKELNSILATFIGKTPNQLYLSLDKPDEYIVKMNKNNKITSAEISYNYIYNFNTKKYDCKITFITNKQQQTIIDYKYSSNKCIQMTMY